MRVNGDPKLNLRTGDYRQRETFLLELYDIHKQAFTLNEKLKEMVKQSSKRMKADDKKLISIKGQQKKVNSIRSGLMRLARELQGGGVRQGSVFRPKFVENRSKTKVEIRLSIFSVFLTNLDGIGRHLGRQNGAKIEPKSLKNRCRNVVEKRIEKHIEKSSTNDAKTI